LYRYYDWVYSWYRWVMMEGTDFFRRWKEGIDNLNALEIARAKATGMLGGTIGLVFATVVMMFRGMWYFGIFLFFMIWVQYITYIQARKQVKSLEEFYKCKKGEEDG